MQVAASVRQWTDALRDREREGVKESEGELVFLLIFCRHRSQCVKTRGRESVEEIHHITFLVQPSSNSRPFTNIPHECGIGFVYTFISLK